MSDRTPKITVRMEHVKRGPERRKESISTDAIARMHDRVKGHARDFGGPCDYCDLRSVMDLVEKVRAKCQAVHLKGHAMVLADEILAEFGKVRR